MQTRVRTNCFTWNNSALNQQPEFDIEYVSDAILTGTPTILELCKKWNAKLIYSASSSKFGNNGKDENLSPYAWMKAKMVELIKNYH